MCRQSAQGFEQRRDTFEFARLVEKVVGAERQAACPHRWRVAVGQHDGEQLGVMHLQVLQHAEAAAFAQLEIHDSRIEAALAQ